MRALLALCLLLSAVPAEIHLVCAGVEVYDDPGISPLRYAVADAAALAEAFIGAGVSPDQVAVLTTNAVERHRLPTKGTLLRALQTARSRARSGDSLIFAFSGHGLEFGGQTYLLTCDTNAELLAETALSMGEVNRALQGFQGKNLLVVVDACRNDPAAGKAVADARLDDSMAKGLRPLLQPSETDPAQNIALLLACDVGQRAWEMPAEGHGAFTYWLIEGLRREVPRTGAEVRLEDLAAYLRQEVSAWAKRAGRQQTPRYEQIRGVGFLLPAPPRRHAKDELPLPTPPAASLVIITSTAATILVDGAVRGEASPQAPLRVGNLTPGPHLVAATAPGLLPTEVTAYLEAGQAQQVELTLLAWPTLTILVGEPGVELLVDGQRVGLTETAAPTVLTTIRPGRHTVVGRKGGREQLTEVELAAGQELTITLWASPTTAAPLVAEIDTAFAARLAAVKLGDILGGLPMEVPAGFVVRTSTTPREGTDWRLGYVGELVSDDEAGIRIRYVVAREPIDRDGVLEASLWFRADQAGQLSSREWRQVIPNPGPLPELR